MVAFGWHQRPLFTSGSHTFHPGTGKKLESRWEMKQFVVKVGGTILQGESSPDTKLEELSGKRMGRGWGGGMWALSSPLTNMRLCLIIKCLLSCPARQSHGPPKIWHTHCGPTLLTRVNRAMICAWCSRLVIGEDLHPHPTRLHSTCLSCLPELIYLGDKQVDEGRRGPQTELHCQTWQPEWQC